jgi:3-hydroxyacyl-CoA dehydrogenase
LTKALTDADFVQENGQERADFKIKLSADLDQASPVD